MDNSYKTAEQRAYRIRRRLEQFKLRAPVRAEELFAKIKQNQDTRREQAYSKPKNKGARMTFAFEKYPYEDVEILRLIADEGIDCR